MFARSRLEFVISWLAAVLDKTNNAFHHPFALILTRSITAFLFYWSSFSDTLRLIILPFTFCYLYFCCLRERETVREKEREIFNIAWTCVGFVTTRLQRNLISPVVRITIRMNMFSEFCLPLECRSNEIEIKAPKRNIIEIMRKRIESSFLLISKK